LKLRDAILVRFKDEFFIAVSISNRRS